MYDLKREEWNVSKRRLVNHRKFVFEMNGIVFDPKLELQQLISL